NTPNRGLIVELAEKNRLPTIYPLRGFVEAGGLMTYTVDLADIFSRAAGYIDQILKGTSPGDIPVYQAAKSRRLGGARISMPTPIRSCAFRRGGYGAHSNGTTLALGRPTRSSSTFRTAVMCRSFSCVRSMLRKVPDRWLIPLVIGAIDSQ